MVKQVLLRVTTCFVGTLSLFFLSSTIISAHFLRMSDGIGVTLHVEPDDDPATGEKTALTFDFKDAEGSFQIKDCSCVVKIFQDQQLIDTQLVEVVTEEGDVHIGRAWTTFPTRGVYTIQLTGDPIISDQFMPFMSSYDIRVQRISQKTEEQASQAVVSMVNVGSTYLIGGVLAVVFLVCFIYFQFIQPRSVSRKGL